MRLFIYSFCCMNIHSVKKLGIPLKPCFKGTKYIEHCYDCLHSFYRAFGGQKYQKTLCKQNLKLQTARNVKQKRTASDSLKFRTHRQLLVPEFVTLNFDLYDRWLELQLCTINDRSIGIADKLRDRGYGERNGEERRTKLHGPGDKAIENLKNSTRKNGNETSTCFEDYSKKTVSWNLVHLKRYVLSNYLIANLRYKNWLQNFGWFFFNNNSRETLTFI